jgi:hemolysin activation/secretion protein
MNKKLMGKILAIATALSIPVGCQAATTPSEHDVRQAQKEVEKRDTVNEYYRQQELLQNVPEQKQETIVMEKEKAVPADKSQTLFAVKKIEFGTSEILSTEELKNIAGKYEGKELSLSDLNAMLEEINQMYTSKKVITAKAVLPPQKITDGIVRVKLIEGHYGDFKIVGNNKTSEEYILSRINLKKAQLVRLDELEKSLTYFNKTNDISLKAELVPGKEVGATDCILHVQEPPVWETTMYADNAGSNDSGLYRIGALTVCNTFGSYGESLVINTTATKGTLAGSISYSQPINIYGTKVGVGYSKNTLDIIDGNLESMDVKGDSEDLSITLVTPLKVTSDIKSEAFAEVHHKLSETDFFGNNLLHTVLNTYTAGYSVQQNFKGGLWYANISGTQIRGSQKDYYTNKNFSRGNATLMRQQVFDNKQIFTFRSSMQYSNSKELPSSEQFSLGGISTVKGFKESEISGEKGYYCGLEYSMLVDDAINGRVYLDLDHGAATQAFRDGSYQRDYLTSASIGYSQNIGKSDNSSNVSND